VVASRDDFSPAQRPEGNHPGLTQFILSHKDINPNGIVPAGPEIDFW